MSDEQEAHLQSIKDQFVALVDTKYRKGEKEHGGDLWLKQGIIDMALDEVVDLAVYLLTLKQQIRSLHAKLGDYKENVDN